MRQASLALGFHLHQPVGNFATVIERAYQNCYLPFINLLSAYPEIKFSLHISGSLLDYLELNHPDFLAKLKDMSGSGQAEFISGAYYEPILPAIPEGDVLGQIALLSDYIAKKFNHKPKGIWIPERVWAPKLPVLIHKAGIKYCILDDTHFLRAGLKKDNLYGYYLTGKGKEKLAVFPSDKKLRYAIPFAPVNETMGYFREVSEKKDNPLFTYGDDAEKFGEWPGTYKWVYEEKWLVNFLNELRNNSLWLKTVHFSDYLDTHPALGEIEIPCGSYDEMMDWSAGSWLNFLKKYPEAGSMHKKMFYVSRKIASTLAKTKADADKLEEARRFLYKGQCNCGYWHGVFGGLYLYHLRAAIYGNLIQAEKKADEIIHKKDKTWRKIKIFDFDNDAKVEAVMESNEFSLYLDPRDGGVLKELDFRPFNINLINTLARRKEAYHEKILEAIKKSAQDKEELHTIHDDIRAVDPAISEKLIYDRLPRYCLRDHFLNPKTKQGSFRDGNFFELGAFAQGAYKVKKKGESIILESHGLIGQCRLNLSKQIRIKSARELRVEYSLTHKANKAPLALFAVEFNLTLPFLNSKRYKYVSSAKALGSLEKEGREADLSSFGIIDQEGGLSINLQFSPRAKETWYFPVKTVSQSERAYELNFQCSCIVVLWQVDFTKYSRYNPKIGITLGGGR